jgi:hypothetical protein
VAGWDQHIRIYFARAPVRRLAAVDGSYDPRFGTTCGGGGRDGPGGRDRAAAGRERLSAARTPRGTAAGEAAMSDAISGIGVALS